jgi:L-asparagine oxygenase
MQSSIAPQTKTHHASPEVVDTDAWSAIERAAAAMANVAVGSHEFVRAAGHAARLLPAAAHDALVDFGDQPAQTGALLLRGLPVGLLPHTPPSPTAHVAKDRISEFVLLTAARRLGQPVGYEPEHGGDLVQNIVPTKTSADRQVSTSSRVELMFHTEAAFHPHRPRYLLLLCLRGDPSAATTLSSIHEVLPQLPDDVIDVLFQPRFRTAVDESYLHGRPNLLGPACSVLSGPRHRPTMVFDADLMVGMDRAADEALQALAHAVASNHTSVVLAAGDLLVVDNTIAVHGRSPFVPRFDGTDRWLQRTFVVSDLAPSAAERDQRVITTHFGC